MIKEKKRYVALKIQCKDEDEVGLDLTPTDVIRWITRFFIEIFGEINAAEANITLIEYNTHKKLGIVRVALSQLDNFKSAMALIRKYKGEDAHIEIIGVSGTIKKCREKFIRRKNEKGEQEKQVREKFNRT